MQVGKNGIMRYVALVTALIMLMLTLFSFAPIFASAQATTTVIIHYKPAPDNTKDWNLWVWPEGGEGKAYPFTGQDAFGKIAQIDLLGTHDRVGFIVRTDSWEKDGGDRLMENIATGVDEVWVKSGDDKVYTSPPDGEYRPPYENIDLTIHYHRYDNTYDGWNLWVWPEEKDGQAVTFTGEDEYGKVANVKLQNLKDVRKVGFIVRKSVDGNDWAEKECNDRFVTRFDESGKAEIWIAQGIPKVHYDPKQVDLTPHIVSATIDDFQTITLQTNFPFSIKEATNAGILINDGTMPIEAVLPYNEKDGDFTNKVKVITAKALSLTNTYTLSKELFGSVTVEVGRVLHSDAFDKLFYYPGNDLGVTYSPRRTKFRLWAPTASEAKLVTYKKGDDAQGTEIPMRKSNRGTWMVYLNGDQDGLFYTYKVKIGDKWNEAVDPYARALSVNGDKGAVIDMAKTNPDGWKAKQKPAFSHPEDAIIYEVHVRDLSIHPQSGITHKGKFLGVAQTGTRGPNGVKTGLDHIKDLGVTHVQFIPIYDYDTASVDETKLDTPQYNWGYDPKNYNAPEGSYATDPYKPDVRIRELKQMIQTLHDNDLRVIMDVVYNHTFTVNTSNFNKLVPGYFYRYKADGTLANGTGVGNDTASERKMMRKFIVDSVTYWAEEYNLDGYRFDLMGIHDVETMNQVRAALDKIDLSLILIGEGWDLNTPLAPELKANQKNAYKMERIGHFNDDIRDGLKGSVFLEDDAGFVNGKPEMELRIKKGVVGGIDYSDEIATYGKDPSQVVTYVEAHDNHTLWDKLELTNPEATETERKQMHKLASSIILTSQGISFLHAGQEFMRTKYGDHNSYRSPDAINQMDWERRAKFDQEVEYMKGLIALRKSHPAFRMTSAAQIREHLTFLDAPESTVAFVLQNHANGDKAKHIVVIHNANHKTVEIALPVDGKWNVLVNGERAGTKVINTVDSDKVSVPAISTMVLVME